MNYINKLLVITLLLFHFSVIEVSSRDLRGPFIPYTGDTYFIDDLLKLHDYKSQNFEYLYYDGVNFSVFRVVSDVTCKKNRCINIVCLNIDGFCKYKSVLEAGPILVISDKIDIKNFAFIYICDEEDLINCIFVSIGERGVVVKLEGNSENE